MSPFKVALALVIAYADLDPDRAHHLATAIAGGTVEAQAAALRSLTDRDRARVQAAIIDGDPQT